MDTLLSNGFINPSDFINLYPLFVIDVSQQSERLKESTVDIQIRAKFSRNVPANTEEFALVIFDKILQVESDGQKMNVVFWKKMDEILIQLLFTSRPTEVYASVIKVGKQLQKRNDGIEEWKQAYVVAIHK